MKKNRFAAYLAYALGAIEGRVNRQGRFSSADF
jgi:hypothetical protein